MSEVGPGPSPDEDARHSDADRRMAELLRGGRGAGAIESWGPLDPQDARGVRWDPSGSVGVPWDPMGSQNISIYINFDVFF